MRSIPTLVAAGALVCWVVAACGDDAVPDERGVAAEDGATSAAAADRPHVVVTTSIMGDMVAEVLGDEADIEVIMPLGADPHDFAASARQAEAMEEADLLVINGAGFEEGLVEVIDSAEQAGAPVFSFADHVDLLELTAGHEEHDDAEAHAEDTEGEGADHTEGTDDPHIWTDPSRMATAVSAFVERAIELPGIDAVTVRSQAGTYVDALTTLDADVADVLAAVPPERRVLVTNHEVFGYFADRYDFEVIGAVIPSLTTHASASAADVEALAGLIRARGVPAIFAEATQPARLAEALAAEGGDGVEVVELFTESLGPAGSGAETYIGMMTLDAERIATALS